MVQSFEIDIAASAPIKLTVEEVEAAITKLVYAKEREAGYLGSLIVEVNECYSYGAAR